MGRQLHSVLVANRGEIAVRILRACRESGIRSIAVYSDADRVMPHVTFADEAYRLGPPPSRESYLLMDRILDVARVARVDAIHPGYGFLAENADFAQRVADAGFRWVGPPASAIRAMGDKTAARALVRAAGVPTVPGTDGPVDSLEEARAFSARSGYPVLIKAAAGGGGKGMRIVGTPDELASSFEQARSEARSAFGDARVYIERYLDEPRHIEFQILADEQGNTVHLGERECSVQRRHQKVVEETPSVFLDDALRARMAETAITAARACGYVNAGTIEFLVDRDRHFYFLEMNTRLQVEHPVTELRTGIDLVKAQLEIAAGNPLPFRQEEIRFSGHAIECRICAEDPLNGFLPSTGRLTRLRAPGGPGIREDRGVEEGGEVSVYYDSLIAKLAAWAPDRETALARMSRALAEYVIEGVTTNIPVCTFIVEHPAFRKGTFDTGFLQKYYHPAASPLDGECTDRDKALAILCAWIEHSHTAPPAASGPADSAESWAAEKVPQGLNGSSGRKSASGWKARRTASFRDGAQ
ncbi:MAG: acetyl-CoA carboxylase biotin carboxylase subunit [Bacteroidetes bacterium]|nr:acetyl-CoA carboxylase biotin carboxylase subunit [Bacteroidota bacterium]